MDTQKIKKSSVIFVIMLVVTLPAFFHRWINPYISGLMCERFKIVEIDDNLIVHAINVGQADAFAANLPDGKVLLIDDGSKSYNVDYIRYLKEKVVNTKTDFEIDYLVLTHADSDHIGGTMKLLKNFKINTVFMPKITSNSQTFTEIYNYVIKNCKYRVLGEGFTINSNSYSIRFFEQLNSSNTNDSSQLIKLKYNNKSFLFTGDITTAAEKDYVQKYGSELDCDVLKVAHHGAISSTSQEFLDCVSPEIAILSVGANNDYNHPNDEIIKRLNDSKVQIYRTDKHGNIIFVLGNGYEMSVLCGNYHITNIPLDIRVYVLICDGVLLICMVVLLFKFDVKKQRRKFDWR